ncbi:MAG: hypothetical protein ACI92E_002875 [Oceanicoccus sp.]|jgi:hypothetical protein
MSENKRIAVRTPLRAGVKLSHPAVGELELTTGNISDTGAYIFTGENRLPLIGEVVSVQVTGMGGEDAPLVKMRVVRSDSEGIGLEFVAD